jgi:hypothetical protein
MSENNTEKLLSYRGYKVLTIWFGSFIKKLFAREMKKLNVVYITQTAYEQLTHYDVYQTGKVYIIVDEIIANGMNVDKYEIH